MKENNHLQSQIDELNRKLDLILEFTHEQKLKAAAKDDFLSDLSLIGKDVYDTAVTELDNYSVELNPEILKLFIIKILKNIPTFMRMVDSIESLTDLAKDAGAEDIEEQDDVFIVTTAVEDFGNVQKKLDELDIKVENAQLQRIPNDTKILDLESAQKILRIIDEFEDIDDVQNVYHNLEMTEELMDAIKD